MIFILKVICHLKSVNPQIYSNKEIKPSLISELFIYLFSGNECRHPQCYHCIGTPYARLYKQDRAKVYFAPLCYRCLLLLLLPSILQL